MRTARAIAGLLCGLVICFAGSQAAANPASVRVAAIQYRAVPYDKPANIRALSRLIAEAARHDARIVVLPEMCVTGLNIADARQAAGLAETVPGPSTDAFARLAKRYKLYLIFGMPEADARTQRYFNSQVVIGPGGNIAGKYRKTHLYGSDENWASPGDLGYQTVDTEWGRIGLAICFDINFPDVLDFLARSRVDLFAFSTNWIADRPPFELWMRMQRRSHAFFVAANNWGSDGFRFSGGSLIVSRDSRVLAKSGDSGDAIVYAWFDPGKAGE